MTCGGSGLVSPLRRRFGPLPLLSIVVAGRLSDLLSKESGSGVPDLLGFANVPFGLKH